MTYSVSFDVQDIDDFRQMSVFSCRNTFFKILSHTKIQKGINPSRCIKRGRRKELVPKRPCFSFGLDLAFINQQKFLMMSNAKSSSESIVDRTDSFALGQSHLLHDLKW